MSRRLKISTRYFTLSAIAILVVLLWVPSKRVYSQDPQFSMPQYTPMLINPAAAGDLGKYRAHFNYRSQWKSLGTPFTTLVGSLDLHLGKSAKKTNINSSGFGAGLVFMTDKAGTEGVKLTSINGQIAYRVKLNSTGNLSGGLNIGFEQRSFKLNNGKWGSQFNGVVYDPSLPSGETGLADRDSHLDLGAGVQYRFGREAKKRNRKIGPELVAGLSAYHLGRIKLSETQRLSGDLGARFTGFVDMQLPIGEKIALCPAFYGNAQNGIFTYLGGSSLKYLLIAGDSFIGDEAPLSLEAGVFLRNSDALSVNALVNWGAYSLGLAYGFDYSGLKPYSSGKGGFELNLRWVKANE